MPLTPTTVPILVHIETQGDRDAPAVVAMENGGFLVVWESDGVNGEPIDIYMRLSDPDGAGHGEEIRVNQSTDGWQSNPDLADLGGGR